MAPNWQQRALLLSIVLLLVGVIVTRGIGKGEFDYNVDESQHAATGLYVSSLLQDRPVNHLLSYTYRYYAQYPALSGVIHWPPLFYATEGAMFSVFGSSVVTARLTILLFALTGWFYWFRLCCEDLREYAATVATLLMALLPCTLFFEKAVMLEIPCLCLCIITLYYWRSYLTTQRRAHLYLFSIFFAATLLTKQSGIFIALVCLLTITLLHKWTLVLNRRCLGAAAVFLALAGPFYLVVYLVHWKTIAMDLLGQEHSPSRYQTLVRCGSALVFYIRALPQQLGWPLLILAILGIVTYQYWNRRESTVFMLSWLVGGYLTFSLIHHKEARYSLYWLPPFIYFAAGFLTAKWRWRPLRVLATAVAVLVLGHAVVAAWNYRRPYLEGYAPVAARIRNLSDRGVILYDAPLPANFIFYLRKLDQQRGFVVLRKSLRVMRIKPSGGMQELARTVGDVSDVMKENGVKYVVTSDAPAEFEAERSLQTLLHTGTQFELLGTFGIESNQPQWQTQHLLLYRNKEAAAPTSRFLRVPMMTLPRDIVVPWDELNQTQSHPGTPAATTQSKTPS